MVRAGNHNGIFFSVAYLGVIGEAVNPSALSSELATNSRQARGSTLLISACPRTPALGQI